MRLATKILLLMLLITVGTSAALACIVTLNVRAYETRRANDRISTAIDRYVSQLEGRHRQVQRIVSALLEAPVPRSQLQAADEAADPAAREQLRQEIFGRTVQTELAGGPQADPAFHVVVNLATEVILAIAPDDPGLEKLLTSDRVHWPVERVTDAHGLLVSYYVATPAGLFLAMGVPLHTQLSDPPSHAYFIGYRVDDDWIRHQLISDRRATGGETTDAPLSAWFVVDDRVVARASADPADARVDRFTADTPVRLTGTRTLPTSRSLSTFSLVEFEVGGERYLGHSFDLRPAEARGGRLVLASSLDQALAPLRRLQQQILLCTIAAAGIALLACRSIARRIAQPITELVLGTERIAAGEFDEPVGIHRHDELGLLSKAFNQMSQGLRERETLREERMKMERDLAVARKIQMDVLPKQIPPCPGYDLAAYSLPAEQTGGDIYDLVALTLEDEDAADDAARSVGGGCDGDGRADPGGDGAAADADAADVPAPQPLVVLLADAAGHGIGPALSVTQVRSMLRIGVRLRAGLSSVFNQINRQLCQDLGAERFVTAFLGVLDPGGHCVNYRSAGQAPLLHYRAGDRRLTWLDSTTMPLGVTEDPPDDGVQRLLLEPGDLFILLTDGFYEYPNAAGQQFGRTRVADVIVSHHAEPAKIILSELLTATKTFGGGVPQLDDMTALIIKRHPPGHPPDAGAAPADRSSTIGAPTLEIRLPREPRPPARVPAHALT